MTTSTEFGAASFLVDCKSVLAKFVVLVVLLVMSHFDKIFLRWPGRYFPGVSAHLPRSAVQCCSVVENVQTCSGITADVHGLNVHCNCSGLTGYVSTSAVWSLFPVFGRTLRLQRSGLSNVR